MQMLNVRLHIIVEIREYQMQMLTAMMAASGNSFNTNTFQNFVRKNDLVNKAMSQEYLEGYANPNAFYILRSGKEQ